MPALLLMVLAAPGVGILLGIAAMYGISLVVDIGTVGFVVGVLVFNLVLDLALLPLQRRAMAPPTAHDPVGRSARVVRVEADARQGRVNIDGIHWRAESASPMEPGQRVLVTGRSGLRLAVSPEDVNRSAGSGSR